LIGYGETPPAVVWPGQAHLALQFVINYEEGGESSILHGDDSSEKYLSEIVAGDAVRAMREMTVESIYEYGSRAGFWRLYRLFTGYRFPVTIYAVASAIERNGKVAEAALRAGWEVASHGLRWINYQHVPLDIEREHLHRAIDIHRRITGKRPLGWYTGRCSPNTRALIVEESGFLYDSDSYADDLPYWDQASGGSHLVVPYTLDANDMRFAMTQGFNTGEQFFQYLKDSFDILYAEGEVNPKMMSVGLHCRLAGRPGRAAGLARFLDYVSRHDRVWICRREDIANYWHESHPPQRQAGL
jgi:putative urate catabolism protein